MHTDKVLFIVLVAALLFLLPAAYRDYQDTRRFRLQRRAHAHPYEDRDWHRQFANTHGYFWKPCPRCKNAFGGHEHLGKTIPHTDPDRAARGDRLPICPPCSLPLRPPSARTAKKQSRKTKY